MEFLQQIQEDLLNQNVSVSDILRKARILAHQIKNEELEKWTINELDGYALKDAVLDYRILKTTCFGVWTDGSNWRVSNQPVPTYKIQDEKLKKLATTYIACEGVKYIEQLANSTEERHFILPPRLTMAVNSHVKASGFYFAEIELAITRHDFSQILDTVRNRLLGFILELSDSWSITSHLPSEKTINNLISLHIYNNSVIGEQNMSIFDQKGQTVKYQYNSAGNINFENIQTQQDIIVELKKLQSEIQQAKEAKIINSDIAIEAEYHVLQASKEANNEKPDKQRFEKHIIEATKLLNGISAAAGLITALLKAIEVAQKIF